jgi:hypothetical protein
MRFEKYPLDNQVCLFHVGSYANGDSILKFSHRTISYDESVRNTILDYSVEIVPLDEKDKTFKWEGVGNFSLSGFEMRLERNILKYVIIYYLPSGMFVIVSWVIVIFVDSHTTFRHLLSAARRASGQLSCASICCYVRKNI